MANDLTFTQISTLLNELHEMVTGQSALSVVDTSSFVQVANTVLKTGYDPVLKAVSQVLGRTIFANRPYTGKFRGLMMSNQQFGNHARKISYGDTPAEDSESWKLTDGSTVDQQKIYQPKILQTNIYGAAVWTDPMTVLKNQLDCAFSSPDELRQFFQGQMQNVVDKMEQRRESTARMTLANLIGGTIKSENATQVVNLLSEYNAATGKSITPTNYRAPENYQDFILWAYSRIRNVSDLLTERTMAFHQNVTGKEVARHTPYNLQNLYVLSGNQREIESRILSSVFNPAYVKLATTEIVNFWQSLDDPDTIEVKASWMGTDGTVQTDSAGTKTGGIFAVLADQEAAGITVVDQSVDVAPYNARGRYQNTFWHYTHRYYNDNTENSVVFLLA